MFFLLCFSLAKGQIFGSWLSHILDIPSTMIFSIWYIQYITWYTWYIISSVNFTFWKTWYNHYKCIIPGILHKKLSSTKTFSACSPIPCYFTGIRRCLNATFAQSKILLLFWRCHDFAFAMEKMRQRILKICWKLVMTGVQFYPPHLKKSPNKPNQKLVKRCIKALFRQALL